MRKEWVCWWCDEDNILKCEERPAELAGWWTVTGSEGFELPSWTCERKFDWDYTTPTITIEKSDWKPIEGEKVDLKGENWMANWVNGEWEIKTIPLDDPFEIIEPHDDGLRVNIHKGLQKRAQEDLWQTLVDAAKR